MKNNNCALRLSERFFMQSRRGAKSNLKGLGYE